MTASTTTTFAKYQASPPEIYERYFVPAIGAPTARVVVDAAELRPGERVLDVACGTGTASRLAAPTVGPTGRVVGIDNHPAMIAMAKTLDAGGTAVEWREAPAEDLPFDDATFDVIVCSLGLQFFEDKVAALGEVHRVLVDGGRAVTGTPGPTPPMFERLHEVLGAHLGPRWADFVDVVFSVHEPGQVEAMATEAGFATVDAQRRSLPLQLPAPADFLWQYLQGTPLAAGVASLDDEARAALERDVVEAWKPFEDGGGLSLDPGLLVTIARKGRS